MKARHCEAQTITTATVAAPLITPATLVAEVVLSMSSTGRRTQNAEPASAIAKPGTRVTGVVVLNRENHRSMVLVELRRLESSRHARPQIVLLETYNAVFAALRTARINNPFSTPDKMLEFALSAAIMTIEFVLLGSVLSGKL